VDPDRARQAVETVLDSWKRGESIEAYQTDSAAVTVQDSDWQAGCVLMSYEVQDDDAQDEANLHCRVHLRLRDRDGREMDKQVTYVIGTSPAVTVFREMKL
jgi:hypothetical protein